MEFWGFSIAFSYIIGMLLMSFVQEQPRSRA
jgi:hypothetical protein